MTHIIGGSGHSPRMSLMLPQHYAREQILSQIPKELREKHQRLNKALDSEEVSEMLEQSLQCLMDKQLSSSHTLFADVVRLILALQLSVAESQFGNHSGGEDAEKPGKLELILP